MDWSHAPAQGRRLVAFGALSVSLHAAALATMRRPAGIESQRAFDPASQTLAGETLDVEPPSTPVDPIGAIGNRTATPTAAPTPTRTPWGRVTLGAATTAPAPPALFGAVGARFATDLATTFTRAFPQAASADPVWSSVAFGSAGRAEVGLVLDEEGRLTGNEIAGFPSPALRKSIERTLALLTSRSFTARAARTKLRVSAYVSRNDVRDGLHGDVFALSAGSFSGDVGAAFFALPLANGAGRRIDVEVRLMTP